MLAAARARFPDIDVRAAGAADLPLPDGQARGYRADKVYHVLPDPHATLTEARRVLARRADRAARPGLGHPGDRLRPTSTDPRHRARPRRHPPHPRIARAYRNLLLDAGFHDVDMEVHTAVFTDTTMLPILTGHATAAHEAGAMISVDGLPPRAARRGGRRSCW